MLEWFSIVISSLILEDPTTLAVSAVVQEGEMSWASGVSALFFGIGLGDSILYGIGALIRLGVIRAKKYKVLTQPVTGLYIFAARFIPGLRIIVYTSSGYFAYPFLWFLVINLISCIIWSVALLVVGAKIYEFTGWWGIAGIIVCLLGWNIYRKFGAVAK